MGENLIAFTIMAWIIPIFYLSVIAFVIFFLVSGKI